MGFHSLDELHEEMATLLGSGAAALEPGSPPRLARPLGAQASGSLGGAPPDSAPRRDSTQSSPQGADLALFTYPLLVDEGKLSDGAGLLKEALEEKPFVEVHPADAERLGISDGQAVRLRTTAGGAELPARVTDGIAQGCVCVPWNQPGLAANTLLSGNLTTPATLEPAKAEVSA